ncbi:unnamed protein product [Parnassius apollo]|uniref:(apollo) hypothetical protein n=1 Tax=Parnassius apollo TaxID=110799 RepID=A0A8S3X5X0_PARAO|nr:unnamed protein product [Parnassius apollo]
MSNTEDFSDSGSEYQPIPGEIHTESETDTSCDENIMMPSSLSEPGTSKSRKRSINKENWTVNKRKLLRNSGKENERQEMFESFWNLKDFNQQNVFLYALVQKASVNRKRPKDLSRAGKNVSFKYFLKSHIMTQLAPHQDTCKTCDSLNFKIRGTDDENVKKEFEVQKELHQRKADSARENLQIDAKKINDAYVLTFDLQKALAFPKLTTSKKTTCGYDFNWLNIRWLRFERNHPLQFQFKETLNADMPFYKVDLSKKQQGRPAYLYNIQQGPLYPSRRPVTIAKKKDMLESSPIHSTNLPSILQKPVDIPTRSSTRNADERSSDDEITYD